VAKRETADLRLVFSRRTVFGDCRNIWGALQFLSSMPPVVPSPLLASVPEPSTDHFGHDAHVVQFYQEDHFLVDAVGEFLREGVRAGEPILVLATAAHREDFARHLTANGHDVEKLVEQGRLTMFDASSMLQGLMAGYRPDPRRFRELMGGLAVAAEARSPTGRFRVYGEMVDLLWRDGNPDAAIQLEGMWNDLAREYSFTLLCAYSMNNFGGERDGDRFADVCRAHSRVVPTERFQLLGDADSRTREVSLLQQRARALEGEIERRRQVEEELREALRVRDDFLCVAGHELRTPLTVLRLQLASLLARGGGQWDQDPRTERRLTGLATQTERLARLAERLLDVSQLGDLPALQLREINLTDVVRDSVAGCAEVAAAAGCQVRVIADPCVMGRWDPDRLEQVVQDLLSNAYKFGSGADVRVQVRALPHRAEIVVRDGGLGIPAADQSRIFERFERHFPTESYGGLGLGLWIARRLVEAHGGEIRVESSPGQGATFTVTLPTNPPIARRRARA
jgi:signal transduction histidine kinase